jgi:peptidyl-tRNA hydrolase, PTH1 family
VKLFGGVTPADWLIVGLGNPGARYEGTPHNVGFEVARRLTERWGLGGPKKKFNALLSDGRTSPGGPRVAILLPQTYMNESGNAAGPARGALKVELDHVVAVHDEIDLPFGEVRTKLGGGLAGHNGLKSLKAGFGSPEFVRVRVGVGRPDTTDPEIVSAHVLGRWRETRDEVGALVDRAAEAVEALVEGRATTA